MTAFPYTGALIMADFKTPPYDHQMREFERFAEAPARAMAWHMRTGKSKVAIDRACHLYKAGKIDALLIFAPNGVHANWVEREVLAHEWPSVESIGYVWRSSELSKQAVNSVRVGERDAWLARQASWVESLIASTKAKTLLILSVNTESMTRPDVRRVVARLIRTRRVLVVFDESDDFGTPGAKRTKMARAIALRCPFRIIMSGTIITGSPLQAFSQYELLKREALGFRLAEDFNLRYAVYEKHKSKGGRVFEKIAGFQNEDELRERMARYTSVVLRDECNMPALVRRVRKITPSPQQIQVYRDLHESFVVDVNREQVDVGERAPRFMKLQQVMSGFVIDEFGTRHRIPGKNPRLEALAEEVYLAPGKVIVWCQFQADIDFVKKRLLVDGHKIVEYHGRVSDKVKRNALNTFMKDRGTKALVGHAKSGGRGVDMSVASSIIWYSHTFSARTRQQAMERATKIGGKNIEVVDFKAPGPDDYILATTEKRVDVADAIAGVGLREFLKQVSL